MSAISQAYLMWVGHQFYPTIESFVEEAKVQGVSKRLPTTQTAAHMMEPGSVVFLAHDEGVHDECPACLAPFPCHRCRGRGADGAEECLDCHGAGLELRGSGGTIVVDGEQITFRAYCCAAKRGGYRDGHDVDEESKCLCENCGGTGWVPRAQVFGLFLPSGFDAILAGDDPEQRAALEERGFTVRTMGEVRGEQKRGCGFRRPGVYVVTSAQVTGRAPDVVRELVESGKIDASAVEVTGDFIRLLAPLRVEERRFLGVKKWDLPETLQEEMEMIMEAVA